MSTEEIKQEKPAEEPSTHTPIVGGVNDAENDGKKIFIGNISYSTTPDELKEFISQAGGSLVSIDMPKRFGAKPAGYAFVVYASEEDAKAAVAGLDGKKLGDRDIGVQLAKTSVEALAARTEKRTARKKALAEKKKAAKAESTDAAATGAETDGAAASTKESTLPSGDAATDGESTKKPRKKKAKKPARRLPEEGEDAPEDAETEAPNGDAAATGRARKSKRSKKPKAAVPNEEAAEEARIDKDLSGEADEEKKKAREPRKPREPKWAQTDVPSQTTIFVANLPFTVDDEALAEMFTSLEIKIKSASVVRKPQFSKKVVPRSKGFGFVEVEDEAQQKLAIEKLAGKTIGDRELTIKVANTREPIAKEEEAAEAAPAEAAAATA